MVDFRIIGKRAKSKDVNVSTGFDDSNTKYYQFLCDDDDDEEESKFNFGIVNHACTEHEEFISSEDKIR